MAQDNENNYRNDGGASDNRNVMYQKMQNEISGAEKRVKRAKITVVLLSFVLALIIFSPVILFGVIYYGYDTNLFSFYSQLRKLDDISENDWYYGERVTENDKFTMARKMSQTETDAGVYMLTDREVGAYVCNEIEENEGLSISLKNGLKLDADSDFELLSIDLYDTFTIDNPNHLSNIDVVLQLNMERFKENELKKFPAKYISSYIPEFIKLRVSAELTQKGEDGYSLKTTGVRVNNLSATDSKKLVNSVTKFAKIGSFKKFGNKICTFFVDKIIGGAENSLINELKSKGALFYSFYTDLQHDYFVAYEHTKDETAVINYHNTMGARNNNVTEYNVLYNQIELSSLNVLGYNFLGWYNGEGDDAEKIGTVNAWKLKNLDLYARWQIIEYSIEYSIGTGQILGENPETYTIESEIDLCPAGKSKDFEVVFQGWTFKYKGSNESVPGYGDPDLNLKIRKGTYGNLILIARFDDERLLSLYIDGQYEMDMTIVYDESFEESYIAENLNPVELGMAGYSIKKWYSDPELTKEYDFSSVVDDNMALYSEWEYVGRTYKFYPYLDEFETGIASGKITIDSYDELLAYFQYMILYYKNNKVTLSFTYIQSPSEINSDLYRVTEDIGNDPTMNTIRYSITSRAIGQRNLELTFDVKIGDYAKYTADPDKALVRDQLINVFTLDDYRSQRSSDYDDFKINNIARTLTVSKSWQLRSVVEQGYRPICEPGSDAELIYNEAKRVLRQICDDSMNDYKKILAIYEWIAQNVSYDHKAANSNNSLKNTFKAYYLEGVFIDKVAVCAGIAQSLMLLAKIEGIPAVYVTGNNHAWNRVLIDGKWYVIDATHGDITVKGSSSCEILSFNEFLFDDATKADRDYPSEDHKDIEANDNYCYYKNVTHYYNYEQFDLYIESISEFSNLVDVAFDIAKYYNLTSFYFEFELSGNVSPEYAIDNLRDLSFFLPCDYVDISTLTISDADGNNIIGILARNVKFS